jgi:hypothetical protein
MKSYVIVAILFITGPFLYLFLKAAIKNNVQYKPKSILTDNELDFFWKLSRALPDTFIFPQVAISALIEPTAQEGTKAFMSAFGRISQKRVDYALFDAKLKLICIVELDDKSHQADKDKARDYLLKSAGIRTIRWHSKKKPDAGEIQKQVYQYAETTEVPIR